MIDDIIRTVFPLSEASLKAIERITHEESIPSGTVFVREGELNTQEYFLLEGVCRSFVMNARGEEITLSFFQDKSIVSPHISRTNNNRSNVSLQALTPLKIAVMDAPAFAQLMVDNIEVREFGNAAMRNELRIKVDKELGMASLPARDRLVQLRQNFPTLENRVPHHVIATYLGITPISLSRLRKNLLG